ncbi:hypothetical protein L3Q67_01245 [Saccharothrix sp. AJ9571]|nr:hypothetical protein L3Q67_01245 [Saccharothrix sp. AJ9571]
MVIAIRVIGNASADEARELRKFLSEEDELRGRVNLDEHDPRPDALGGVSDILSVALVPGGAATVLSGALIAWLRQRRSDITLRVENATGSSVELRAKRIKNPDVDELEGILRILNEELEESSEE